jgi:hypothetical protein
MVSTAASVHRAAPRRTSLAAHKSSPRRAPSFTEKTAGRLPTGDITTSRGKLWSGIHFKKHPAGSDLTEFLKDAPHEEDRVLKMKRVGRLKERVHEGRPFPMKVFYFLAYLNLVFVFLIVFIVSLWRWGLGREVSFPAPLFLGEAPQKAQRERDRPHEVFLRTPRRN